MNNRQSAPPNKPVSLSARRPHPKTDGQDDHIPLPLYHNPPTADVIRQCTEEQIARVLAYRKDPNFDLGAHAPHLCVLQGGQPVTIYGALHGVEVLTVYTCAHGNLPDLRGPDGEEMFQYCYECGLYLPIGLPHSPPPKIAELL